MSNRCTELTKFVCKVCSYTFGVMPLGLMNAPATYRKDMDKVLEGLRFARVYLVDIVIFSKNSEEHLENIGEVLHRIS